MDLQAKDRIRYMKRKLLVIILLMFGFIELYLASTGRGERLIQTILGVIFVLGDVSLIVFNKIK